MKQILKNIPNCITLLSLFSGCVSLIYFIERDVKNGFIFIIICVMLDFFDGFVARKLKASSELGKQIDSLADMVVFGLISGYVMFIMFKSIDLQQYSLFQNKLPYFGFFITLGSCFRLAKFNCIDEKQYFIGLPTPANSLLIICIALIKDTYNVELLQNPYVLIIITLFSTYIMNSSIHFISFKGYNFAVNIYKNLANNKYQSLLVFLSVVFLVFIETILAIFLIITLYIFISCALNFIKKNHERQIK